MAAAEDSNMDPKTQALKTRIITHMNTDHFTELTHYLRAFGPKLSARSARGAQLTDITLGALTLTTSKNGQPSYTIPLTPPMSSLSESRTRLVAMAQQAQSQLGLSDIFVRTASPPSNAGLLSGTGVSFFFLCVAALPFLRPGTYAWHLLDGVWGFAGGAQGFVWLVRAITVPTLVIHVSEAWWMAKTRLDKHSVDVFSRVWWAWVVHVFLCGVPAFWQFDELVDGEKKKREGVKH